MEYKINPSIRTPYFLVDENLLLHNLEILKQVSQQTGCKILLAQKAFSMFSVYPLMRQYLAGTTASGLYEARLGKEEFGGETHIFSPAYREDEFQEILQCVDDIVFNSPSQLKKYAAIAKQAGKSVGLRLNPECSTQEGHAIYDPCSPGSRLGTTLEQFDETLLPLLDGLHFHTLCEQNSDDLEITVNALEQKFGKYLSQMKWLNLGGGHHITRSDYDIQRLIKIIQHLQKTYGVQVYLEPGEAVVLNAGFLGIQCFRNRTKSDFNRNFRYFRRMPHAGCFRNALPSPCTAKWTTRRKILYLSPSGSHLFGWGCDW